MSDDEISSAINELLPDSDWFFRDLGRLVAAVNEANGIDSLTPVEWATSGPFKIPAFLALIHSEVSEALEAFRVGDRDHFAEELADVLIRVVHCAHGLGINLGPEVIDKVARNRTRGHRHGKRV